MSSDNLNVYLLIDNGLLQEAAISYAESDSQVRPSWLIPIYTERALAVSPILIDLETAYEAGGLDQVMGLVNALAPALHVSIIETGTSLAHLTQHLRRFIFILDPERKQFTLRYTDCAILIPLSSVLTSGQWATMRGPIVRWRAHDRSGCVVDLPPAMGIANGPAPLCLDHDQIVALDEVSEPDHCIAKVKMMHHGTAMPGTSAEQYAHAEAALQVWRASKNSRHLSLLYLTEAALVSRGEVLRKSEITAYLMADDVNAFRENLRKLATKR